MSRVRSRSHRSRDRPIGPVTVTPTQVVATLESRAAPIHISHPSSALLIHVLCIARGAPISVRSHPQSTRAHRCVHCIGHHSALPQASPASRIHLLCVAVHVHARLRPNGWARALDGCPAVMARYPPVSRVMGDAAAAAPRPARITLALLLRRSRHLGWGSPTAERTRSQIESIHLAFHG